MLAPDNAESPEFAVAMRGYDRAQVDDYLGRLHEWLLESQARTAQAEEKAAVAARTVDELRQQLTVLEQRSFTSTPDSINALGDRVGKILNTAFEAAEDMRTTAEQDAARLVAEAEARASGIVEEAERRASEVDRAAEELNTSAKGRLAAAEQEATAQVSELMERARAEAEALLEDARRQRNSMEQQVKALADHRARAEDDLGRLHQFLAEALQRASSPLDASDCGPSDAGTSDTRTSDTGAPGPGASVGTAPDASASDGTAPARPGSRRRGGDDGPSGADQPTQLIDLAVLEADLAADSEPAEPGGGASVGAADGRGAAGAPRPSGGKAGSRKSAT